MYKYKFTAIILPPENFFVPNLLIIYEPKVLYWKGRFIRWEKDESIRRSEITNVSVERNLFLANIIIETKDRRLVAKNFKRKDAKKIKDILTQS
jgi:hypothetical protein